MKKIKVKATSKYEQLNIKDKELNRILKNGEEFEISEERYVVLTKNNKYNAVFVEKIEEKNTKNQKKGTKKNEKKNRR